jgi:small membrane protein
MNILQILVILFVLFAWSRAFFRMRDKSISIGEFSLWSLIWIAVLIVSLFPSLTSILSKWVGIGRGMDLALYASVILLFYLMFRLYVKIDSQNQEVTKLVREIAIRDAKKKK